MFVTRNGSSVGRTVLLFFLISTCCLFSGCTSEEFRVFHTYLTMLWNSIPDSIFEDSCSSDNTNDTNDPIKPTTVPTSTPIDTSFVCDHENARLGTYSWDQGLWQSSDNNQLTNFFSHSSVRNTNCGGDLWINIGDYSSYKEIANKENLKLFLSKIRLANDPNNLMSLENRGVIYMTYGDAGNNGLSDEERMTVLLVWIEVFEEFLESFTEELVYEVGPIGISFDIEHGDPALTVEGLKKMNMVKNKLFNFPPGTFLVQHVIEGRASATPTSEAVFELADSALFMVYRSYYIDQSGLGLKQQNNLYNRFKYMLETQCPKCLSPDYSPKAKISILVESDCNLSEYCGLISFCAQSDITYVIESINQLYNKLESASSFLASGKFNDLFGNNRRYGLHNWVWGRCQYPYVKNNYPNCSNFSEKQEICRQTK